MLSAHVYTSKAALESRREVTIELEDGTTRVVEYLNVDLPIVELAHASPSSVDLENHDGENSEEFVELELEDPEGTDNVEIPMQESVSSLEKDEIIISAAVVDDDDDHSQDELVIDELSVEFDRTVTSGVGIVEMLAVDQQDSKSDDNSQTKVGEIDLKPDVDDNTDILDRNMLQNMNNNVEIEPMETFLVRDDMNSTCNSIKLLDEKPDDNNDNLMENRQSSVPYAADSIFNNGQFGSLSETKQTEHISQAVSYSDTGNTNMAFGEDLEENVIKNNHGKISNNDQTIMDSAYESVDESDLYEELLSDTLGALNDTNEDSIDVSKGEFHNIMSVEEFKRDDFGEPQEVAGIMLNHGVEDAETYVNIEGNYLRNTEATVDLIKNENQFEEVKLPKSPDFDTLSNAPPSFHIFQSHLKQQGSDNSAANEDFVLGLDDFNKFVEKVDPPDELDVSAGGKSMQEVLVQQGTQIVLKRIQMGIYKLRGTFHAIARKDGSLTKSIPPSLRDLRARLPPLVEKLYLAMKNIKNPKSKKPMDYAVSAIDKAKKEASKLVEVIEQIWVQVKSNLLKKFSALSIFTLGHSEDDEDLDFTRSRIFSHRFNQDELDDEARSIDELKEMIQNMQRVK